MTGNGLALRCDESGTIHEVVCDTLVTGAEVGTAFLQCLAPESRDKGSEFLRNLRSQQAAFNWELTVTGPGGSQSPLHFGGAVTGSQMLIVGARNRAEVSRFYEELLEIQNEQVNALRSSLKELSVQNRAQFERDFEHYEELTRLNSELTNIQRELAKKNVELTRLNEQKTYFLGMASHDLRNPLNVIQTYSDLLLQEAGPALTEEQIEYVEVIRTRSEFMLGLITNFLDFSALEAGQMSLDLQPVDIEALLHSLTRAQAPVAIRKQVRLSLQVGELPLVTLDPARFEQVFANLVGNAVKFSPPGSEVKIRCELDGDKICFSVEDQGPGLSREERQALFRAFQRGTAIGVGGDRSYGLGLSIVQRLVQRHGGDIRVESEPGRGACFSATFPLRAVRE